MVARSSTGPIVSFHWYVRRRSVKPDSSYVRNVPTFVTQPPGKRRNCGSSASIFSARSLRSTDFPLTGPTHVSCGKSDTWSSASVPAAPESSASRPAFVVPVAVSVTSYLFHAFEPSTATWPVAYAVVPAASSTRTVTVWAVADRAQTEKS
ncbi:Uncharacterised protein [Mycobacteroides abscessus]|nr:Uncharacterised protein [Mycobacteroides abscessus]